MALALIGLALFAVFYLALKFDIEAAPFESSPQTDSAGARIQAGRFPISPPIRNDLAPWVPG